jgi:parvulin-like peptidyl-prolyl isomerase
MKRYPAVLMLALGTLGCDAMTSHTGLVARVGQHELTVTESAELMAGNPQIPAQTEVVGSVADLWVDYTILAELMAEDSTLAELDLTSMVRPYAERQKFMQLREQVVTTDTAIADEELAQLYEEQAPGTRVRARHILLSVPSGADDAVRDSVQALADQLQQQAAEGADFAALAQEYSDDRGSGEQGGDLGWFQRGRMVQPFEEAAFALEPGEVSDVVETPFGLHIIKLEERESPAMDESRAEEFRQQLIGQRQQASLNEYVEGLRGPAGMEVQTGAADVVRGLAEDPAERLAGRAGSRELVSWDGGELTAQEFADVLRRLPPQQRAQYAAAADEPIENLLRDVATNELVLQDADERGITVPQEEQDSIRELIREQLAQVAQDAGLSGAPQEGESEPEAVERRVQTLLQGILSGRRNLLPLGALPYVLREESEWHVYERAFPQVVEEVEQRRADNAAQIPQRPATPQGVQPPTGQPPAEGEQPSTPPDTSG